MNSNQPSLASILEEISAQSLPPVHAWNPSSTRDVDIRITRNGSWLYQGSVIHRPRMVKLFSTVLRADPDGHTYLVTPQERLRITVEDAPFTAVLAERHGAPDATTLVFTTNVGDQIIADEHHAIQVEYAEPEGEPSPYILVRDQLRALITRSVFYQLAEWSREKDGVIGVDSAGIFMPLYSSDPA